MNTTYDVTHIQCNLNNGSYVLVEEKETSKKAWQKFLRVVTINEENVTDTSSPRGYAVCRSCRQIRRLGPKGGTTDLEKHICPIPVTVDDSVSRLAEKKHNKNQTEKDRKDEISALIKDMASLVMGQENESIHLQELTRARLTRACLSEIPRSIIQFYTDGKSPTERPLSFYDELQTQLNLLSERVFEARCEAHRELQQPMVYPAIKQVQYSIDYMQNGTPPNLHLGLSYSTTDENIIDITWVSADVESTLGFDRINMIGRNLSELVHPEDYAEVVRTFLLRRSSDGSTTDRKDFSFPECRVTEPIRHRLKTVSEYKMVFLTGYIRPCIRTTREKSNQPDKQRLMLSTKSSWPRLASFIHIYTYYQYMTLHSLDGKIIQADKRITMVAGYTCDEVINKSAHDFIREDALPIVSQAQFNWLYNGRENYISYPLKAKHQGTIVYVKSRGEFVYFRDSATNKLVMGFILNNARIHEEEYFNEVSNPQVQVNSSSGSSSSMEDGFEASSFSSIAVDENYEFFFNEANDFLSSTSISHPPDTSNNTACDDSMWPMHYINQGGSPSNQEINGRI
ncbi:uncharacterized protein LOC130693515 [Daphnia carinata]|uniref:uncharacterized protein LOC130693515 n=1 Tax=Daphnia carinata TaxID=120202 RepID=UPI00257D1977|nr:uncharacterized protein LOC130693515 [Daphnia carinata]